MQTAAPRLPPGGKPGPNTALPLRAETSQAAAARRSGSRPRAGGAWSPGAPPPFPLPPLGRVGYRLAGPSRLRGERLRLRPRSLEDAPAVPARVRGAKHPHLRPVVARSAQASAARGRARKPAAALNKEQARPADARCHFPRSPAPAHAPHFRSRRAPLSKLFLCAAPAGDPNPGPLLPRPLRRLADKFRGPRPGLRARRALSPTGIADTAALPAPSPAHKERAAGGLRVRAAEGGLRAAWPPRALHRSGGGGRTPRGRAASSSPWW